MTGYEPRKYIIGAMFIVLGLVYVGKLFMLQVVNDDLKMQASDIGKRTIFPARGLILDRNGRLIVGNQPIYELLVVQRQVGAMDTAKFCELLGINDSIFEAQFDKLRSNPYRFSRSKPEPFLSQISIEKYQRFEEHLHEFPGFVTQVKVVRTYPYRSAAHVVGDIGEVSPEEREASINYYHLGEYVGKSGIEKQYEKQLRGKKGVQYYMRDNLGRDLGPFQNGIFDTQAVSGSNLFTTLDIELQQYGELLMQNKRGSIVAIEPSTGEVLAFVSSPTYDPNLLVGRQRGDNFRMLVNDIVNKPLINRPLTAIYPPGSIFKALMGLIAINEGAIGFQGGTPCAGAYVSGGVRVGCHAHPAIVDLNMAIQHSCNAYFCNSLKRLLESNRYKNESEAIDVWADYLHQFGYGGRTGIDLPGEGGGNIPNSAYFDRIYKGWRWRALTVISLGIGQGEITTTPLQMAHSYAILANQGRYYVPHVVKSIEDDSTTLAGYKEMKRVNIDPVYFAYILDGMEAVVTSGTARQAKIEGIAVCGKTGTAENPHGKDHSIFAAFAPKEAPQIAIAVVVENSGFGGTWAAPIASLMMEFYLKREIPENRKWQEERMLNANFIQPQLPAL